MSIDTFLPRVYILFQLRFCLLSFSIMFAWEEGGFLIFFINKRYSIFDESFSVGKILVNWIKCWSFLLKVLLEDSIKVIHFLGIAFFNWSHLKKSLLRSWNFALKAGSLKACCLQKSQLREVGMERFSLQAFYQY